MTNEQAKELMEKGWKAREALDFETAEKCLLEAKKIFEQDEDWFSLTECLNHLAYTDKLKAKKTLDHGLSLVIESLEVAQKKETREVLILRALISLLNAQGNFEEALKYARIVLDLYEKPINKADIMQHIAALELRTGRIDKAEVSIEKANELLNEGWENEKEPHRSIWKVSILLTKGLILYNKENLPEAKKIGEEALDLATKMDLKTRITQAQIFLDLFK